MKEKIHTLSGNTALFIKALWLLARKVTNQVILPNRNRKGNILSSILLLFVSLTDLVANFSWGISIDFITHWKHYEYFRCLLKKSVLIAGCFLFLLSSFEWSYNMQLGLKETGSFVSVEQQVTAPFSKRAITYRSFSQKSNQTKWKVANTSKLPRNKKRTPSITSKIYLQNCDFRI